jgi:SIR2-like domain
MTGVAETGTVLEDIARSVAKGECILFLGAGAHAPPPQGAPYAYPEEERPPFAPVLSRQLAESAQVLRKYPKEEANVANLQRMALFYETAKDRQELVREIAAAVQDGKRPSPALRALAELDFPLVITTNYDTLFERALIGADKDPVVNVYSKKRETTDDYPGPQPTARQPFLFKIHGDIGRPESIVVTDEDYIDFVLRMGDTGPLDPVPLTFRYLFQKWKTLFVGYSLIDYNLRLLFKTLRWKIDKANIPSTYSVDLDPDPLIVDVWDNQQKYVKFVAEDIWTFVPALYEAVKGKEMPGAAG